MMILDNEQQRKFLLEMFQQINFPGTVLDDAFKLKQAIINAENAAELSHQRDYATAVPLRAAE